MSFHRAKKKLIGSFSKRKKFKLINIKDEPPHPPPLPRSFPPFEVLASGENKSKLHPSTSLPELWDESFQPGLVVFTASSASLIDGFGSSGRLSSSEVLNRAQSTTSPIEELRCRSLEDVHVRHELPGRKFSEGSHVFLKKIRSYDQLLEGISYGGSLEPDNTAPGHEKICEKKSAPEEVTEPLLEKRVKNFMSGKTSKLKKMFRSKSFSSTSTGSGAAPSDMSGSTSSYTSSNHSRCSSLAEMFNHIDQELLSGHEVSCSSSQNVNGNHGVCCQHLVTNNSYVNDSLMLHVHENFPNHSAGNDINTADELEVDRSVLKKIQFFENIAVNHNEVDNIQDLHSNLHDPNINVPHSYHNDESKNSKFATAKSSGHLKTLARTTSAFSVFSRVFPDMTVNNQRLDFDKFRRSQSIPEAGVLCCTTYCSLEDYESNEDADVFVDAIEGCMDESRLVDSYSQIQVCHHPQCMEENHERPLHLCRPCDLSIHRQHEFSGHLVLDTNKKRSPGPKPPVIKTENDSDSDPPDTQSVMLEDQVDGLYVKNSVKQRNRSPSEVEKKLHRKKALRKKHTNDGLEAALTQIADPEHTDPPTISRMDSAPDLRTGRDPYSRRDSGQGDLTVIGVQFDPLDSPTDGLAFPANGARGRVRRQNRVTGSEYITLKFARGGESKENFEVVGALESVTLRETIAPFLEKRGLDLAGVNVFVDKSKTPLPMDCDVAHLKGTTLEIKEKDDKDEQTSQNKKSSSTKSNSGKNNKQSGRNSRRDSVGVVPLLLEPPPNKQRRGSLQLPFREHFFKGDSKSTDGLKVYDDSFGSLRGRDKFKLSIDDTFYPPVSPSGTLTEGKKNRSQKLSVVNLFTTTGNKDRERQDQLNEILNRYSSSGLPPLPALLTLDRPSVDENMFAMELNWHLIVDGDESLTKKQQEHQEAVWELLHTEVSYIKQIRVIIDVFRNCLINIQSEGFLNDVETERLFSNIDKIYECNCIFWQKYLLPVLVASRDSKKPLDPLICKSGFVEHFPQLFEVYFKYVIEHKSCLDYAKSCMENSDLFKCFIFWAEAQKQCNRLKLADILVKPMQRLVKYSLLLHAILKHTENDNERAELKEMIQSVDKLCSAANNSLQRREEYEKLEAVRSIIDPYDAIEAPTDECTKIIQEYSNNFSLLAPITGFRESIHRSLLFQATLRMKDAQNAKADVECFLFTDLILICKSKKMDRFKIIKPPMRLDQIVISDLKDKNSFLLIYMNEYRVPIAACTFHSDAGAIRVLLEKFREAQKEFKNRKLQDTLSFERRATGCLIATEDPDLATLTSVPSDQNISSFPRSDSTESADHFIPNLTTHGELSNDVSLELGRSGSTGDIQSRSHLPSHKELAHIYTDPTLTTSADSFLSDLNSTNAHLSIKHKQINSCRSVPNITVGQSSNSSDATTQKNYNDSGIFDNDSVSSLQGCTSANASTHFAVTEQSSIDEDLLKQKLNARRVSRTEKRYHTADSIPEIKSIEKDNSIHKRLSWRTDIDQSRNINNKTLSTDSLSCPSSSGVSSSASLHLNSDITEESESTNYTTDNRQKIFSVGGLDDLDNGDDNCDDEVESSHSKQKLNPVNSIHISELQDGIASVAVDSIQKKLTAADILKFKKLKHQVLDDANIESSEV